MLEQIADWIENDTPYTSNTVEQAHELLNRTIEAIHSEQPANLSAGDGQSFITLLRGIDGLATSLAAEIASRTWHPA